MGEVYCFIAVNQVISFNTVSLVPYFKITVASHSANPGFALDTTSLKKEETVHSVH